MGSSSARCALLLILSFTWLTGCASSDTQFERNLAKIGFFGGTQADKDPDLFDQIAAEPTNARLHFENGLYLLSRGRYGDLELANVAFRNASRLAPDWWLPELAVSAAEYRLGRYDVALSAFTEAVKRRGACGTLCYGLSFVAFRAGYFGLAANALASAERAGPPVGMAERTAAEFVSFALADGPGARPVTSFREQSYTPIDEVSVPENVTIDAYVIRQGRDSSSSNGINLLKALELQFDATLVNLTYREETGESAFRQMERLLEVSIPTIKYALNVASEEGSTYSIEAAPSVVAVTGKTSKFFEGANVLIVPNGDDRDSVERDIGISLEVTPDKITDSHVDLTVSMELSNLATQTLGGGAQTLQTEKARAEASARIPFGRAMALGSGAKMVTRSGSSRVPGAQRVPGLGYLFGVDAASASRNDVLVLIAVRRVASAISASEFNEFEASQRLFGIDPAPVHRVSSLPSEAPAIDFGDWLMLDGSI